MTLRPAACLRTAALERVKEMASSCTGGYVSWMQGHICAAAGATFCVHVSYALAEARSHTALSAAHRSSESSSHSAAVGALIEGILSVIGGHP